MTDFRTWLEMAGKIRHLGDWGPGEFKKLGWERDDFGILTSPAGVAKINRKWAKCPHDIELYVYRGKGVWRQRELGEVDANFLTNKLGLNVVGSPAEAKAPRDIYVYPQSVNIVYTNNTGAERMPFTYWTAAHRLGHAIRLDRGFQEFGKQCWQQFRETLHFVYGVTIRSSNGYVDNRQDEKIITAFCEAVGTMKSARDGLLRNHYEFLYELLAQYIIEGGVRFNDLPRSFGKRWAYGRSSPLISLKGVDQDEYDEYNAQLHNFESDVVHYADFALSNCVGKIFVI